MKKINAWAKTAREISNTIVAIPLVIMGAAMVVVVIAGTFWRYVLNDPLLWTEEAARYLMIWVVLIGASVAMKHREHVRISILIDLLPRKVRLLVQLITNIFVGYFLYILLTQGWQVAQRSSFQISPALGISMFWPILAVPITGLVTLIQLFLQTVIDFTGGEG